MSNFEKYRKKKNIIKCSVNDSFYQLILKYLEERNLTQQDFLENIISETIRKKSCIDIFDLERYVESVRKFVNDSNDWYNLDFYKHYVSTFDGSWEENSDNCNGGFDVSWSFHKNPSFEDIRIEFIKNLNRYLDSLNDNDIKKFEISIKIFN